MKRPYLVLGSILWLSALAFTFLPSWPHIYYRLSPQPPEVLAQTLSQTQDAPSDRPTSDTKAESPLPPVDLSLPKENGLIIESIGVRGEIHQGDDWEEILKTGIWQVPNFGSPKENDQPIILAAHRWGYLDWTSQFRHLNSFYNLPTLSIEDKIIINWNQRQYIYEVYEEEVGEKITNYSADLILYTCQLWNSPIRIIKYAKRIN